MQTAGTPFIGEFMYVLYSWLGLSVLAYGMYAVAYIFESRKPGLKVDYAHVPVWDRQSKAFLPGDLGLALAIAVAPPAAPTLLSGVLGLAACLVAFYTLRYGTYKPKDYTKAQWNSPSKRYHDYVISFAFAFLAVTWWFPVFKGDNALSWPMIVAALMGLLLWMGGVAWDAVVKQVPNRFQHPEIYWPIWRKQASTPFG